MHELRVLIHKLKVQIHELRVQIRELLLQIYELRVQIHELGVQILELRVQIHELWVQIHKFKNDQINENSSKKPFKTATDNSFPNIVSPKLLKQLAISASGDNLLHYYVSATPWLWLQQETEWITIEFGRRYLSFLHKNYPTPMILGKFAFFFAFNLRKQNVTDFYFIFFYTKFYTAPLNYCCQILQVFPHPVNGGLSDIGCLQVPFALPHPLPDI